MKFLGSFLLDIGCKDRTKAVTTKPNRFMAHINAALVEQILDVSQRQWKPDPHHHHEEIDLGRSLEVAEWILHSSRLSGANQGTKPVSSDTALSPTAETHRLPLWIIFPLLT